MTCLAHTADGRAERSVLPYRAERRAPADLDPVRLVRCSYTGGFEVRARSLRRDPRVYRFTCCVYHPRELRLVDDVWIAPCGHPYDGPLTEHDPLNPEEARRFVRAEDRERWRRTLRSELERRPPELLHRLASEDLEVLLEGFQPREVTGGCYMALWLAEGPDRAVELVLAEVERLCGKPQPGGRGR